MFQFFLLYNSITTHKFPLYLLTTANRDFVPVFFLGVCFLPIKEHGNHRQEADTSYVPFS
jgi:hypothetical protein